MRPYARHLDTWDRGAVPHSGARPVGYPADLGQAVSASVKSFDTGGDGRGPWLEVAVHAENGGKAETSNPSATVMCHGSPDQGGRRASSVYNLNAPLPPGTFADGTVHLLLPDDGRTDEPVPACAAPAVGRLSGPIGGKKAVVAIPGRLDHAAQRRASQLIVWRWRASCSRPDQGGPRRLVGRSTAHAALYFDI
jgi:hypothetical protein